MATLHSPFLELGNLEDAGREPSYGSTWRTPCPGFADLEVLCDPRVIWGSPFAMTDDVDCAASENLEKDVYHAYVDYLAEVLHASAPAKYEALSSAAYATARKHGLKLSSVSEDWAQGFGRLSLDEFQGAYRSLASLVRGRIDAACDPKLGHSIGAANMTRLVCHCSTQWCHAWALADRLWAEPQNAELAPASEGPLQDNLPTCLDSVTTLGVRELAEDIPPLRHSGRAKAVSGRNPDWRQSLSDGRWATSRPVQADKCPSVADVSIRATSQPNHASAPNLDYGNLGHLTGVMQYSHCGSRQPPASRASFGHSQGRHASYPKPPWGDRWGAAGIVALQQLQHGTRVCLVEKRNGQLGFPKGRADIGDPSAMATALREWQEEAMLSIEELDGLSDGRVFIDCWGCHYFFAEWRGKYDSEFSRSTWDVKDDPLDRDPVIRAHWMPCQEALWHPHLGRERKDLLRTALQDHRQMRPVWQ